MRSLESIGPEKEAAWPEGTDGEVRARIVGVKEDEDGCIKGSERGLKSFFQQIPL
jgi:hypothetical protein